MRVAGGLAGDVLTSPARVVAAAAQAAAGPVQIDARFYPPSARKLLGQALAPAEHSQLPTSALDGAVARGVHQGQGLGRSREQNRQIAGEDDDLLQLEQLLEQQLSAMALLSKDPAVAAAAVRAPAGGGVAVAARGLGAGDGAAGAAAAWQAGYDGDVDTASGSGSSNKPDAVGDSSSSGSRGSVRYWAAEGGHGRPTSANRLERLVAVYRQQQQQPRVDQIKEVGSVGAAEHAGDSGSDDGLDGAGNEDAGLSEMLSRFLQE
ncbi:hypothetical protein COO60DRAFT_1150132 [Scenedesmus sp. NREL 46B-D3]|nr:hypothetical protein COO60DRAFT_1150132 [Scenedesmus sp. NREL 46B-D3]